MSILRRRRKIRAREELIDDLVTAWNAVDKKADLVLGWPEIYSACSWLAAHETVHKEMRLKR